MKSFNSFLVCIMFLFGTCTVVWAQGHRHSERNDSTESVVLSESGESRDSGIGEWIDDDLEEYIGKTISETIANSFNHEREGWVLSAADRYGAWGIFIAIIVVTGIFLGPVIVIALILLFIYKRKKSRDAVVIEAIRNGRDIPYGYGSPSRSQSETNCHSETSRRSEANRQPASNYGKYADQPIMQQGIKKIAIGLGLYVISRFMYFDLLGGIGLFVVIYGIGQIVIGYVSAGKFSAEEPVSNAPADHAPAEEKKEAKETTTTEVTTTENEKPE